MQILTIQPEAISANKIEEGPTSGITTIRFDVRIEPPLLGICYTRTTGFERTPKYFPPLRGNISPKLALSCLYPTL